MAGELSKIQPGQQGGFSLIELLVVIAILSVLSVGSTLLMTRSRDRQPSDLAAFRQLHDQLRSLSVHEDRARGVFVTARGRQIAEWTGGRWQASGPELRWRSPVRVTARGRSRNTLRSIGRVPQIIFLPDGRSTAFDISFGAGDQVQRCRSDGWSDLICSAS